jgi:pyrophosphatase PpaX
MRFPVVLFDLDGTVIDSGAIILASMRHAAREVLGVEVPDEQLMAAVGGPGLEAQMQALSTVELAFAQIPIEHLFETVVGGDETKKHKPDPEPLLLALERLGAAPDDAVYVGDAPFDVKAAKAAGLYSVGVSWGGIHGRERLEAEKPDALVDTTEELLGVL